MLWCTYRSWFLHVLGDLLEAALFPSCSLNDVLMRLFAVYELTPAWHAAPTLNDEPILKRACRSFAPWERPRGDKPEPFFRSWSSGQNEIYSAFTAAEREGLEFVRFKVPPETPVRGRRS